IDDSDDGLVEVVVFHAGGAPKRARAGHVAAMGRSAGTILRHLGPLERIAGCRCGYGHWAGPRRLPTAGPALISVTNGIEQVYQVIGTSLAIRPGGLNIGTTGRRHVATTPGPPPIRSFRRRCGAPCARLGSGPRPASPGWLP